MRVLCGFILPLTNAASVPITKLKHLVTDVQASAELHHKDEAHHKILHAIDTFILDLDKDLKEEIQRLESKETVLKKKVTGFITKENEIKKEALDSYDKVHGYRNDAESFTQTKKTMDHRFHTITRRVMTLISFLENAVITRQGILITPEAPDENGQPSEVFKSIHSLLESHPEHMTHSPQLLQVFESTKQRLTQNDVNNAINGLSKILSMLETKEDETINQTDAQRIQSEAALAQSTRKLQMAAGEEAEVSRHYQEMKFTLFMIDAMKKQDTNFSTHVEKIISDLKQYGRFLQNSWQEQKQIFRELMGPLGGQPTSFLQIQETNTATKPLLSVTQLQGQIQQAIAKKQNTHALLMKLTATINAGAGVQKHLTLVEDLSSTLHDIIFALEQEENQTSTVKRLCKEEDLRAGAEVDTIHDAIQLMSTSKAKVHQSMSAATKSLEGLDARAKELQSALDNFSSLHEQYGKIQTNQWEENKTILLALEKAVQVANSLPRNEQGIARSLQKLETSFLEEQEAEHKLLDAQGNFLASYRQWVKDYEILLWNRQKHYTDSFAQLELLYVDAVGGEAWNGLALQNAQALQNDTKQLCSKVLIFENSESKTRSALKAKLAALSNVLGE